MCTAIFARRLATVNRSRVIIPVTKDFDQGRVGPTVYFLGFLFWEGVVDKLGVQDFRSA